MNISWSETVAVFDQIVADTMEREEAADWATERQRADKRNELVIDPPDRSVEIRAALEFLAHVDMREELSAYFTTLDDIVTERKRLAAE